MTQKTAMQQMIEMIESVRRDEPLTALWNLKKYAQELKATEKEDLIEAWTVGREYGCKHDDPENGEDFYNSKYGQ